MSIITSLIQAVAGTKALASDYNSNNESIRIAHNDLEGKAFKKDGSVAMTGDIAMGGHKITNLDDPTNSGDAVNLNYVNNLATFPVGTPTYTACQETPDGFADLDGQALLIADYQDITDACYVGDTLNATADAFYKCTNASSPNTSRSTSGTYLALPDDRGKSFKGAGSSDTLGTYQADQVGEITIPFNATGIDIGVYNWASYGVKSGSNLVLNSGNETRVKSRLYRPIIKY